jgi:hypothetical protein
VGLAVVEVERGGGDVTDGDGCGTTEHHQQDQQR